jgi:NAD(P)-dependent dehydrogenase (short-subunit alcohol dehydrogenase family)
LINNAGYSPREGVIEAANMSDYPLAFEVNFWGPVQVVQAMTPLLRRFQGSGF